MPMKIEIEGSKAMLLGKPEELALYAAELARLQGEQITRNLESALMKEFSFYWSYNQDKKEGYRVDAERHQADGQGRHHPGGSGAGGGV